MNLASCCIPLFVKSDIAESSPVLQRSQTLQSRLTQLAHIHGFPAGSEGETDTLQHTRSSFADEGDTQYTQSDNGVSRSLDATGHTLGESMADDHSLHQSGVDSSRDFTPEPAGAGSMLGFTG